MRINPIIISLILSAFVHVFFVLLLSIHVQTAQLKEVVIDWANLPPRKIETEPEPATQQAPVAKRPIFEDTEPEELDEPEDQILITEEISPVPQDSVVQKHPLDLFLNDQLTLSKQNIQLDSLKKPLSLPLVQKMPPLPKIFSQPGNNDKIDKGIYERNLGHPQPVPVASLLFKGAKYLKDKLIKEKPPELNFIPTKSQLVAFNTIWENGAATDQDIYSALDSTIRITSLGLNSELARLEENGFLSRKIVSPRQELMIMTPIGAKGVEMSPTNRRNRIYEYKINIPKDQVVRFLNAALYQVENGLKRDFFSPMDSTKLSEDLKEKILLITGKEPGVEEDE